ncbi:MAG: transposase [Bryobacteraceae bacterium]
MAIDQLCQQITTYCELGGKVMDQTRRRVLDGEQVPVDEKVYSIFEDHTQSIKRGKQRTPVEFGHKVFLAESAQGLITDYPVLDGNPADTAQVKTSLERHRQVFQRGPEWYAGDRGFYSVENEEHCRQAGAGQVCIPQRGGQSWAAPVHGSGCGMHLSAGGRRQPGHQKTAEREALERSAAFKKGQRFRAGIEGRIPVLFRGRGMKRCRAKGRQCFEVLAGAAVLANNLPRIPELLRNSKPVRGSKAA